jgi:hypothetical protein
MQSTSLPFDSEGHRYLADVPMTPGNKRIVFRSHGMETRLTPAGRVSIHDHWLDTNTSTWHSEWRDVTDWSRTKILDFLGY